MWPHKENSSEVEKIDIWEQKLFKFIVYYFLPKIFIRFSEVAKCDHAEGLKTWGHKMWPQD